MIEDFLIKDHLHNLCKVVEKRYELEEGSILGRSRSGYLPFLRVIIFKEMVKTRSKVCEPAILLYMNRNRSLYWRYNQTYDNNLMYEDFADLVYEVERLNNKLVSNG